MQSSNEAKWIVEISKTQRIPIIMRPVEIRIAQQTNKNCISQWLVMDGVSIIFYFK